ncbi:hypothetical protein E4T56_gene20615 [Termitomyces sp. T112]|nr:hypothetical protein E4T56_gene20615 [Termitomyces sp. T112]
MFPTPPIVAPPPAPAPPTASCVLATLEAATIALWRSLQNPSLSSPTLRTSSPHAANNLSNSSAQRCREALTINHNPPADGSTKVPEVREYTIGLGEPANAGSPHAHLLGPTSSKGDALRLLLLRIVGAPSLCPPCRGPIFIGGHPCQPPPLPRNPSLRPCPSDPPPTALQPTHDPTSVLLQCKQHANSE